MKTTLPIEAKIKLFEVHKRMKVFDSFNLIFVKVELRQSSERLKIWANSFQQVGAQDQLLQRHLELSMAGITAARLTFSSLNRVRSGM